MSAADIYAQCLLPLKEGYPLYRPELHCRLNDDVYDAYRRKGISIGDIGIIRPGGDFDFLFNICRTRYSHNTNGDASGELTESLRSSGHGSLGTSVGISEQLRLPSTVGDLDSRPSAVSRPDVHPETEISERVQHLTSRTAPTDFELIDTGEISITPNYVSTERPYLAHGRDEQTTFNAEVSLNPIA
jgi:hypothetical protein